MKTYSKFVCQQCGYESTSWFGRCPNCQTWNSLIEQIVSEDKLKVAEDKKLKLEIEKPQNLQNISLKETKRIPTGFEEFDRVLGGGIVSGTVILLAGNPGIGKSTLLLQLTEKINLKTSSLQPKNQSLKIFYICGEESPEQIKIRAQRLGIKGKNLMLLPSTDVDIICTQIKENRPFLVIIDSIQTLETTDLTGSAGSIGQVRECTSRLLKVGKSLGVPIFLIGHVTKEGAIAGPMVLEHLVDTVLFLEGERFYPGRTLRSYKNRFGPTDEIGIFQMEEKGLVEVKNPSEIFLQEKEKEIPGSVVVPILEGTRPILVEIQALVNQTNLAFPRRIASGFDINRLLILTAIISKRLNLPLANWDIFINIPGGLKIKEPAADLGVALAIVSSFKNKPLPNKAFAFGEVGLLGEVRRVIGEEKRIKEAKRLGFNLGITSINCKNLYQATKNFF